MGLISWLGFCRRDRGQIASRVSHSGDGYSDDRYTAIHEAGHAAACLAMGQPFALVSIVPEPGSFGRVTNDPAAPKPPPLVDAVAALAGPIAIDLWFGFRRIERGLEDSDWTAARVYAAVELAPTPAAPPDPERRERVDRITELIGPFNLARLSVALWDLDNSARRPELRRLVAQRARIAERVLRRHWPAVIALAEALLKRRSLDYEEARAVWAEHFA
jgi:hypothetical protein